MSFLPIGSQVRDAADATLREVRSFLREQVYPVMVNTAGLTPVIFQVTHGVTWDEEHSNYTVEPDGYAFVAELATLLEEESGGLYTIRLAHPTLFFPPRSSGALYLVVSPTISAGNADTVHLELTEGMYLWVLAAGPATIFPARSIFHG